MAVRIDDLVHPHLTDAQQAMLDGAAANPVSFDEQHLLDAAVRATGLDDFGPDDFWPRFRGQIAAIEGDTGQTELSRHIQHRRAVGLLSNRLRLTDLLRRYPEIEAIELEAPLIVVGMPRSGTIHLVT